MKATVKHESVEVLVRMYEDGDLWVNPEYQRGLVWKEDKMLLLIDSILRGYQIPLIFLRKVTKEGLMGAGSTRFEIIDGQQRINALCSFRKGIIITSVGTGTQADKNLKPLLNPSKEEDKEHFLSILSELERKECEWAGETYETLNEDIKNRFLKTKVPVVVIEKCTDNEARDLFIRLQGGTSLTPQEVRDAWPGDFCGHVLEIGGKPESGKPGHEFFIDLVGGKIPPKRSLAAQALMLFLKRRREGAAAFIGINSKAIDNFYQRNVDMAKDKDEIARFRSILSRLHQLLNTGLRPKLRGHDVIHLILLADMLWDDYAPSWRENLGDAFDQFSKEVAKARNMKDLTGREDDNFIAIWNYHQRTRTGSDRVENIRSRHEIYVKQMRRFLGESIKMKDRQRGHTPAQRELIYYRDNKRCLVCQSKVSWEEAEIDHFPQAHRDGGPTTLENGSLVHKQCHSRGRPPSR